MSNFQKLNRIIRNPLRIPNNPVWLLALLAAVIVACGGDPTANTAPATAQPVATAAAPAAVSPTDAPSAPTATTRAPGARP